MNSISQVLNSISSVQFGATQLCPTLCDSMDYRTPGLPVHQQLQEFTQTHLHQDADAIQPSHPLSSPSPTFPGGSDGKDSACNAGDPGLIPGSGRASGEGNGHPLQYSCPQNSLDRAAWQAKVHGITKESDTAEQLKISMTFCTITFCTG